MSNQIITNGREATDFTKVSSSKGSKARKLAASLLVQSEKSAADLASVEKYVGELAVLIGGTFTPA